MLAVLELSDNHAFGVLARPGKQMDWGLHRAD